MKLLEVQVHRSCYVVGTNEIRTVAALEAELIRRRTRDARVVPAKDASVRKVAAAVRVFQRLGISLGFVGVVKVSSGVDAQPISAIDGFVAR